MAEHLQFFVDSSMDAWDRTLLSYKRQSAQHLLWAIEQIEASIGVSVKYSEMRRRIVLCF
jgi:hypothetical protein